MNYKIDFFGKRKIFFGISLGLILFGLIFNVIFGTQLDIQFAGGAIVKYSFSGELNSSDVKAAVEEATEPRWRCRSIPISSLLRKRTTRTMLCSTFPAIRD